MCYGCLLINAQEPSVCSIFSHTHANYAPLCLGIKFNWSSSTILMYSSQKLKTSGFSLPSDLSHSNSVMRRLTQPCSAFQESLMKQSHLTVFQHSLFWSATLCLSQSSTPTAYLDSQSGRAFHNSGKSAFMVNLWAQILLLYDLPSIKTEVVPSA